MDYFLTVRAFDGRLLHDREKYESLAAALDTVSARYLTDPQSPFVWSGSFTLRGGAIARLRFSRALGSHPMRGGVTLIEIASAAQLLEMNTVRAPVSH